ncbi:MAG: TonB-dependent receptor plug domain-containing protein [Hahellaceae bacterium]|nr:TonB-dependent receptor plug domain-containing protein [Hahellaceae bacterium]
MKIPDLKRVMTGLLALVVSQGAIADNLFYGINDESSRITTVSASKHDEDLFASPLSISVLTAERIKNSGATSVPEALRLLPGVLVREQTNGVYEVHLRGLENAPEGNSLTTLNSRLTLLMIDNRIVYDYFDGGLFWQSLPVGMDDIARIEVIRGPASALYGSNAAQGVIHIITKRAANSGYASASVKAGTSNSSDLHAEAGTRLGEHALRVSGFTNQRDRFQETYYSFSDGRYVAASELPNSDSFKPYPDPNQALKSNAISLNLNNSPESQWHYDISLNHQDSESHRIYISSEDSPFTYNTSETSAMNALLAYGNLQTRISHQWGENSAEGFPDFNSDMRLTQASLEYSFRLPKWLIQPGIYREEASYDSPFIGGKRDLNTTAYMLRTEFTPTPASRLIAALRLDDYNVPSENYPSVQLLGSYKLTHDTLLRGGVMTAHRSAFMVTHYLDLTFDYPGQALSALVKGDPQGKLTQVKTYEVALRKQLSFNHWFEVELFRTEADDFLGSVNEGLVTENGFTTSTIQIQSLPSQVTQHGLTLNWLYEQAQWDLNVFLTGQQTRVESQIESLNAPLTTYDTTNRGTPAVYGGLDFNWRAAPTWFLNTNLYYLDDHELRVSRPISQIDFSSRLVANVTLRHDFWDGVSGYISARNLSNNQDPQYFYTDGIDPLYMIGVDLTWIR